jgi:mRNA interferase RelE/StbE
MYKVKITPTFESDVKRLDKSVAKRIIDKIEFLAENPELLKNYLKYMPEDLEGLQKYRVGDWRVLLWADHKKQEITLYGVDHRKKIYKKFGAGA